MESTEGGGAFILVVLRRRQISQQSWIVNDLFISARVTLTSAMHPCRSVRPLPSATQARPFISM